MGVGSVSGRGHRKENMLEKPVTGEQSLWDGSRRRAEPCPVGIRRQQTRRSREREAPPQLEPSLPRSCK